MPTIRPYQSKDADAVRTVGIHTGPKAALRAGPAQTLLLATYVDYYIEREPGNCFVIADGEDKAVGYILCAQDFRAYREVFLRDYAPRTKGLLPHMRMECLGAAFLPKFFCKKYPAHLHIDILPEYQRMGLGTALMDTLTAHLREKGVGGVMLGVGAQNKQGRNFYQKYGFRQIGRVPFSVVMGLEL